MKKQPAPTVEVATKWWSLARAAEYLDLTPLALQKQIERKVVPGWVWTRVGRQYRFRQDWIDEWLEEKYRARRA